MVTEEFNNDIHPLRHRLKCVSIRTCGDDWKRTVSTIMAGMICAAKPDYFDGLVVKARSGETPEIQREAKQSIAGVNLYISNLLKQIQGAGGDTYDAVATAQQLSFMLEQNGVLPAVEDVAYITGDTISQESLGIKKPRIEYTESEADYQTRCEEAEKQRQAQCEQDHREGKSRVRIHFTPERQHIVHNDRMSITADVINGFEKFFTGDWIDTPKSLEAINSELSDSGESKFNPSRTIKHAAGSPGASA